MKKSLAVLMLAAMLMSAGCGNTMDGAKKDAQDAAAKVEQKVDEAKDKADEAKKDAEAKVDEMKSDAAAKVDETKDKVDDAAKDAAAKVDEMKSDAAAKVDDAAQKLEDVTADVNGRVSALGNVVIGNTSLEDVQAMFGDATSTDGNVMTFVNGLKVTLDDAQKVKEISTTSADFDTPEGVYVGASEYSLNDYCGPADSIHQIANGAEYEYFSGDKKSKTVYKAQNGIITEITCTLK